VQSSEAISLVDVVLHDLVRELTGDAWQDDDELNLGRIKGSRDAEVAKRRGVAVSNDLLDFRVCLSLNTVQLVDEDCALRWCPGLWA
jgi:hypothetical protein